MKKRVFRGLTALLILLACQMTAWATPAVLIPGGQTVGIKLYSQGLVVTGFDGQSPARAAGMKKGDVIVAVDGEAVHTASALRAALEREMVVLTVLRNGKASEFCIRPQKTEGESRLGAYIRDSVSGIGTVTYYDPETGGFGALGHGVNDLDTGILLPLEAGAVVASSVEAVEMGRRGTPGELKGQFDLQKILGSVEQNTEKGIFGVLRRPIPGEPVPVAAPEEVHPGKAEILANVDGTEICTYSVEILKLYPQSESTGRNLLLEITDQRLLQKTGGIVQGMSGSPILQDGKIVGAVTHVCVNL